MTIIQVKFLFSKCVNDDKIHSFIQIHTSSYVLDVQSSQEMQSMSSYVFRCLLIIVMDILGQECNKNDEQNGKGKFITKEPSPHQST